MLICSLENSETIAYENLYYDLNVKRLSSPSIFKKDLQWIKK